MHARMFKVSGGGGVREWWYLPWGAGMGGGFVAIGGLLGAVIQRLGLTWPNTFRMLGILASRPAPEVSPFVHTGPTTSVLWLCQAAPSVPTGARRLRWRWMAAMPSVAAVAPRPSASAAPYPPSLVGG